MADRTRKSGKAASSADDVLAVTAFLLAGSGAWLGEIESGTQLAKLDLLVRRRDEALRRMAGQLVARLRQYNRDLAAGTEDVNPGVLALIRRGAYVGGREAKYADPADTDEARQRFLDKLKAAEDPADALKRDMADKASVSRLEALLHPQFLLESVRVRELEQALAPCHHRTALVVALKTDPGRAGSDPARDLRGLLDLMEGLATPQWEPPTARSRVMPLKAHVLLEAGDGDLALMARLLPDMPGQFLWLASPAGGNGLPARPDEDSLAASARLIRTFASAIREILGFRRVGEMIVHGNGDPFQAKWHRVMARYRRWVAHLAERHRVNAGPGLHELPGALCFGLGFLCRHGTQDQGPPPSTVAVMAAAFRSARRLARRHCRELSLFLNAERVEQGLDLARQIVDNLEDKGPLKLRGLVRCFGQQRKERFEPVIAALLGLKVMVWQEDGTLATGEAELAGVEDDLRDALLSPASVELAGAQASRAKTKAPGLSRARKRTKPQQEKPVKPTKKPSPGSSRSAGE